MKLKIDGHEYKVRFKHTHYETPIEIPNTQTVAVASTEVHLLTKIEGEDTVVDTAIAYCSKSDQFSKRRGRKVAFAKMLKECIYNWSNNKKMREEAWKQLQSQCKCMT